MHRARIVIGPVRVGGGALPTFDRLRKLPERLTRIEILPGVTTAPPIEKDAIDRCLTRSESADENRGKLAVIGGGRDAEPTNHRSDQRLLEACGPFAEKLGQRRRCGDETQAARQLGKIPMDRFGLAAE